MKRILSILSLVAAFALSACASNTHTLPPGQFAQSATVTFAVRVPSSSATAANRIRPQYVSPNTQSVAFTLVSFDGTPSNTTTVVALTGGNCTGSGTSKVCTISSTAPVGADVYSVATYTATNGTGTPLSIDPALNVNIVSGTNTVSVTLNGVVASLAFSPASANALDGTASAGSASINALDAYGDTIIGPGLYALANGSADPIAVTCQTGLSLQNSGGGAATLPETGPGAAGNVAIIQYSGTSVGGTSGGTLTCTATDSTTPTPLTSTFTLNLSSTGSVTWTIN